MNARERARFDMLKRVGDYGSLYAADFAAPIPPASGPSAAQQKATGLFDALNRPTTGLLARLAANATIQQAGAGDFHGGTTAKSVLRDALLLDLRALNRTAAAVAQEAGTPGLMDHFRIPHGVDDVTLCARARAMVQAATPLLDSFLDFGLPDSFLDELAARVTAFEAADTGQNEGGETRSGATANFDALLREALGKVKSLHALVHNLHRDHAAKLGAWRTASHVERQPQTRPSTASATPAAPTL